MGVLPASQYGSVTPYVGVWIETQYPFPQNSYHKSHPTWVCGLKRYWQWKSNIDTVSHPTWVCGLKQPSQSLLFFISGSHPTWVCGLKQWWGEHVYRQPVTPYVGVWIETPTCDCFQNHSQVTPYVGVWIETSSTMLCTQGIGCHTLRGCVDWNINGPVFGNIEDGHTLRGNIWIGALFTRRSSLWKNCKHSASYVFLSRLLILLWLEKTRTSPNAYLLSVFFCCFT